MADYTRVLAEILNTPLLAFEDKAEIVAAVVLKRAGIDIDISPAFDPEGPLAGPVQEKVLRDRFESAGRRPFLFDPSTGIAVIEVTGSLAHRQWHIGRSSGIMGYDGIGAQLDAALRDSSVRAIIFDFHCAGGQVHGCYQLADRIASARGHKPIVAVVDEMAYSAAMCLAAACDEIFLASDVSGAGSVGVIWIHFSFEDYLKDSGIRPTIFKRGKLKAEGNPYEHLTPDDIKRINARMEEVGAPFSERVARWRGLTVEAVDATEAGIFLGRNAVAAGFADDVATPLEVFTATATKIQSNHKRFFNL